eukprot:TRINITY_DN10707_c0_g1_i1.p1 TRINITY_DN10707_c0_g1~~TRINITY_DN10707_c0_g1_i1.p1  ORF type:complete len:340 (+),score=61.17 TRINITY_DN10707_c0_g1_i1:27-1022(+)
MQDDGLSQREIDAVQTTQSVLCLSSFFCTLLVIVTYLAWKRKFPSTLTTSTSIATALLMISQPFHLYVDSKRLEKGEWPCDFQAALVLCFASTSSLNAFCIVVHMYLSIVKRAVIRRQIVYFYFVASWGAPMTVAFFCSLLLRAENIGLMCFFDHPVPIVFLYSCVFVLSVCGPVLWTKTLLAMVNEAPQTHSGYAGIWNFFRVSMKNHRRHFLFLILILPLFAGTMFPAVYMSLYKGTVSLYMLQAITLSAIGTVFSVLVFFQNPESWQLWLRWWRKIREQAGSDSDGASSSLLPASPAIGQVRPPNSAPVAASLPPSVNSNSSADFAQA